MKELSQIIKDYLSTKRTRREFFQKEGEKLLLLLAAKGIIASVLAGCNTEGEGEEQQGNIPNTESEPKIIWPEVEAEETIGPLFVISPPKLKPQVIEGSDPTTNKIAEENTREMGKTLDKFYELLAVKDTSKPPLPISIGFITKFLESTNTNSKKPIENTAIGQELENAISSWKGIPWRIVLDLLHAAYGARTTYENRKILERVASAYGVKPSHAVWDPNNISPVGEKTIENLEGVEDYMLPLSDYNLPQGFRLSRGREGKKIIYYVHVKTATTALSYKIKKEAYSSLKEGEKIRIFFDPTGKGELKGRYTWGFYFQNEKREKIVALLDTNSKIKYKKAESPNKKSWVTDVTDTIMQDKKEGITELYHLGHLTPLETLVRLIYTAKNCIGNPSNINNNCFLIPQNPSLRRALELMGLEAVQKGSQSSQWGVATKDGTKIYRGTISPHKILGISVSKKHLDRNSLKETANLTRGDIIVIKDIITDNKGERWMVFYENNNEGIVIRLKDLQEGGALVLSNKTLKKELLIAVETLLPFVAVAGIDEAGGGIVGKTTIKIVSKLFEKIIELSLSL